MAEDTIETFRCVLTTFHPDDRADAIRLNTDCDVRRHLGGPVSAHVAEQTFEKWLLGNGAIHRWAVRTKADNSFIGMISLAPHHDPTDIEISYLFLPERWGNGYGKETVKAAAEYALNTLLLPRIVAETQTANTASCRLLESIGMQLEQTFVRFGAEQSIYSLKNSDETGESRDERS